MFFRRRRQLLAELIEEKRRSFALSSLLQQVLARLDEAEARLRDHAAEQKAA